MHYHFASSGRILQLYLGDHIFFVLVEMTNNMIFLDSTKLKIVWTKITTSFKRRVSIIL